LKWLKPCPKSEKRVWRCYRDLQASPTNYWDKGVAANEDYRAQPPRDQLGSQVEIDKDTPFQELSARIARKNWDIAFTRFQYFP